MKRNNTENPISYNFKREKLGVNWNCILFFRNFLLNFPQVFKKFSNDVIFVLHTKTYSCNIQPMYCDKRGFFNTSS